MHLRCILRAAARKTLPFFISPLHHLRFPCQNLSLTQRRSHNRPPCAYPSPRRSPPSPLSHPLDPPIIFSSPSDFWLVCIFFWFLRLLHLFWMRFKERNREKKKEKMGSLGAILKHPEDLFPLLKLKITAIHAEKQIPFEPHWSFSYTLLHKVSLAASLSSSSNFARSSETQCAFSIWFSEALILLALHDGHSVYFLLQVGGDYAYAKGVNTKCPSVAIMLQIGENASYHNCPSMENFEARGRYKRQGGCICCWHWNRWSYFWCRSFSEKQKS